MSDIVYIKSSNIKQVAAKLEKLGRSLDELDKPSRETGKMGLAAVKSYPVIGAWYNGDITSASQRPGSKYKRTFALQKSWNGRINKKGKDYVEYLIYQKGVLNPKSGKDARKYMPYVQGSEQVGIHAPWWNTLDQWREILPPFVEKGFRSWIRKVLRGF